MRELSSTTKGNRGATEGAGMRHKKRANLYPPVLPSWGAMVPSSPPSDYGNISFAPDRILSERVVTDDTTHDEQALAGLRQIFQRRLRTIA